MSRHRIKTTKNLFVFLSQKVKGLHSYSVPEVVAVPIVEGQSDTKSINKLFYLNSKKQNWFWSLFNGIGMIIWIG
ncbi:MAG: divalent-cation tolerance protein CutA [Candidatus Omnitrophica bacterium]|nr:divalent-cation tolerance protein CutA [Candidatus Omnitrophota bacterium]